MALPLTLTLRSLLEQEAVRTSELVATKQGGVLAGGAADGHGPRTERQCLEHFDRSRVMGRTPRALLTGS